MQTVLIEGLPIEVAMIGSGYVGLVSGACLKTALDSGRLKAAMRAPVLIDLRNVYSREEVARHGFGYEGVGRADSREASVLETAAE